MLARLHAWCADALAIIADFFRPVRPTRELAESRQVAAVREAVAQINRIWDTVEGEMQRLIAERGVTRE